MQNIRKIIVALAAGCGALSGMARAQAEHVITVPGFADFLVVDGKTVWATNKGRVEHWSRHGKIAAVAMAHPCGAMAITAGSLWVADCDAGTINRIDLASSKVIATIATGIADRSGELNVVAGAGSIWVASDAKGAIARIDPASNAVVKTTGLGKAPGFLVAGEGAVWVQEQGDGTLARIDADTGEVTARVKVGANLKWGDIDAGGGKVWLRTTDDQVFAAIDAKTLAVTARVGKPAGSGALRYTPAGLWTTAHDHHTLTWWPAPGRF